MRTISTTYQSIVVSPATQPGYLVEITIGGSVYKWSSIGDIDYPANTTWLGMSLQISGLGSDVSASNQGSVTVFSKDGANSELIAVALSADAGFINRDIKIYSFDRGMVTDGVLSEAICIFDGITDGATIDHTSITIPIFSRNTTYSFSPHMRCIPEFGFNHLPPPKKEIPWGDEIFVLE